VSGVAWLNGLSREEARAALAECCASREWARRMVAARPFASRQVLLEAAESVWWELGGGDWLEAFRGHPRIGERKAAAGETEREQRWSAGEQAGMDAAAQAVRAALAEGNHAYEARFGYIYIVCATGRTAEEMLALLRERLAHAPEDELAVAAAEQARITRIRLEKLLDAHSPDPANAR
jgi:OHCU decarboxylase